MKGNSVTEFIDDILTVGGPEKEFVFRNRFYFLETVYNEKDGEMELRIDEYDRSDPMNTSLDKYIRTYIFAGRNYEECVLKFENARIFSGLSIYEAESEIEVLFG